MKHTHAEDIDAGEATFEQYRRVHKVFTCAVEWMACLASVAAIVAVGRWLGMC